jgi:hypothetical protein
MLKSNFPSTPRPVLSASHDRRKGRTATAAFSVGKDTRFRRKAFEISGSPSRTRACDHSINSRSLRRFRRAHLHASDTRCTPETLDLPSRGAHTTADDGGAQHAGNVVLVLSGATDRTGRGGLAGRRAPGRSGVKLNALNYNSLNHFAGEGQLCSDLRRSLRPGA